MKRSIVCLVVIATLLSASTIAHADPVAITAGQVGSDFISTGVYLISDSFGLNLFGGFRPDGGNIFVMPNAFGFHAGDRVDFSATVNGPLVNVSGFPRSMLNGIVYQNQADLLTTANLRFAATPVTVNASPFPGGAPLAFDVTTPFTMSGSIQVASNIGTTLHPVQGDTLLSTDVAGAGMLEVRGAGTASFLGTDFPSFRFAAQNPSPTPEPGTLVLFGTAVAGLLGRRRLAAPRAES